MTDREREYYNTYVRVRDFGAESAADFPPGSAGATNFGVMTTGVETVEAASATQESNVGRQTTVSKEIAAAEILEDMRAINRAARGLGVDNPEIAALFRMPHGNNYQTLLAAATAFYNNSAAHETELIAYGLDIRFRSDLQSNINDLDAAVTAQNQAKDARTGATGTVGAALKTMNGALRRLRGIVPNVYRNNPRQLAAWASAAHVQRAPVREQPPAPNP